MTCHWHLSCVLLVAAVLSVPLSAAPCERLGGQNHEELLVMLQDRPLDTSTSNPDQLLIRQLLLRGLQARQQAVDNYRSMSEVTEEGGRESHSGTMELADDDDDDDDDGLSEAPPAADSNSEAALNCSSVQLQEGAAAVCRVDLTAGHLVLNMHSTSGPYASSPLSAAGGAAVELGAAGAVHHGTLPHSLPVSTVVMHGSDFFQVISAQSGSSASEEQQHCVFADGWFEEGMEQDWLLHKQLNAAELHGSGMLNY
jgi:hypothetical protein